MNTGEGGLTPEEVRRLAQQGETLNVEFKGESRGPAGKDDIVEAAACLANRPGNEQAWLLLGVEDDGTISGVSPRGDSRITPESLAASIAENTDPYLSVSAGAVRVGDAVVWAFGIPVVDTPVATRKGIFHRRAIDSRGEPACLPMSASDVVSLAARWRTFDPTMAVVPEATWDDLDHWEFERFRRSVRERHGGDKSLEELGDLDLAKALGVVEANGEARAIRMAALLLFGKEDSLRRMINTHEVAFQALKRLEVETNDFYRWPLLRVIEEFESRIRAVNREQELMVGFVRVGVPRYSLDALREALANALSHRDYAVLGATHVQWHGDHIQVSNPGGFPRGVGPENLLVTAPAPRNPLLADAIKRAGVVEKTARGIDMMHSEQLRSGHPPPSYFHSNMEQVVVSLAIGDSDLAFVRLVVEARRAGRNIGLDELLVLHSIGKSGRIALAEAASLIQKVPTQAKESLDRLVEAGLVTAREETSGIRYVHSARARLALAISRREEGNGFPFDLERVRDVQMHVDRHGRITRGEVARLCRIDPREATRLLSSLTEWGVLEKRGSRRGTHYVMVTESEENED